jgi:hypothetical protein
MKKMSIVLLILVSCSGSSDSILDLGGGYGIYRDGPNNSYVFKGSNFDKSLVKMEQNIIYPSIIDYEFNDSFIIVEQRPNRELVKNLILPEFGIYGFSSDEERIINNNIADSLLNNVEKFKLLFKNDKNYWIINKNSQDVIGPLNELDF